MSEAADHRHKLLHPHRIYTLFKYLVYLALAINLIFFFQDDLAASAETFSQGVSWHNVVEAYSATIDTAAWVVLLLLFELETAVIPDDRLEGGLKQVFLVIAAVCYFFIVYSFYGYLEKFLMVSDVVPFTTDACELVATDWNYVVTLDEYPPIDRAACEVLQGQELVRISGQEIIATVEAQRKAWGLALVDVVNSATWLIIVVLLQIEVWLQSRGELSTRLLRAGKYVKGFFYAMLFVCAAYWGVEGSFVDFWDAFLWLVAFIFIELNIFQWHEETEEAAEAAAARQAG